MLKHIVQYINTRLLTTGYFKSLYEYVEIKPKKDFGSAPMVYCTGGEWKDIDTEKNVSYIRLLRPISITEGTNTRVSGETVLNISIGLRVVGIVRNTSEDDSYKWANLAFDMSKVISDTSANLTTILNARMVDIIPSSLHINTVDVFKAEFPGNQKTDMRYNYTMAAVDLNVSIEITSDCWELLCGNAVTDCDVLLAALTTSEKNECILPSYVFSNDDVFNNLTVSQQNDLSDQLSLTFNLIINEDGVETYNQVLALSEVVTVNI